MKICSKRQRMLFLLLASPLIITACRNMGGNDVLQEATTLTYANLTKGGVDYSAVMRFNAAHKDVQVVIQNYFDEDDSRGQDRLLAEIAAGDMPDIIDLGPAGGLPYQRMARKGLLENLWPYIENDPELGREGVLEAPLKAAEVDGGLYVVFDKVCIQTLVGAESIVGNRYSWTIEELLDAYASMSEGSTIMEMDMLRKQDVFRRLFYLSAEDYVDWNTGECFYDSEQFRSTLEFINNNFPDEISNELAAMDTEELSAESMEWILSGRQMLSSTVLARPRNIQEIDTIFGAGGRAAFVGYPTEDGSVGSYFYIRGRSLGMSTYCQHKEAAWDFLREVLLPQYNDIRSLDNPNVDKFHVPLNLNDYQLLKRYDMTVISPDGAPYYMGPILRYHKATQEEVDRFDYLMNSIDKINLYDRKIYDIAYETASAYFAGDKTLDETVALLQNRVGLYVNENR
ncbi:MAG: extracellular solute-binding protein [Oscillospiraceae bacterium]|nr:extracellular solute-binding protein [Oscillospiraceae bacterium]